MSADQLAAGDQIRCLHCRRWHGAEAKNDTPGATAYAATMLYVRGDGQWYYVGQVGHASRHGVQAHG
jgi:hypothetical protein